jgi:K+-transporting ATPase KdpF subunit
MNLSLGDAAALLVGVAVLIYLVWTLIFPEQF